MEKLVIQGLIIGYAYAIALSAASIAVCETKGKNDCSQAWSQGFTQATGLVTTFLAYLVKPGSISFPSSSRKEETDAGT